MTAKNTTGERDCLRLDICISEEAAVKLAALTIRIKKTVNGRAGVVEQAILELAKKLGV